LDAKKEVFGNFQVEEISTIVILDREGKIVSYTVGMRSEKLLCESLQKAGMD